MELLGVGRKRLVPRTGGVKVRARALMGARTSTAWRPPDSDQGCGPLIPAWAPSLSGSQLSSGKWELQARSMRVWTLFWTVAQGSRG